MVLFVNVNRPTSGENVRFMEINSGPLISSPGVICFGAKCPISCESVRPELHRKGDALSELRWIGRKVSVRRPLMGLAVLNELELPRSTNVKTCLFPSLCIRMKTNRFFSIPSTNISSEESKQQTGEDAVDLRQEGTYQSLVETLSPTLQGS